MPRFEFNKRTGMMQIAPPQKMSPGNLFTKVKRVHGMRMNRIQMTDDDLRELILKVQNGTRNSHYLAPAGKYHERAEIIGYVLRELA